MRRAWVPPEVAVAFVPLTAVASLSLPVLQLTYRHCQPQRLMIGQPLFSNFPKLADSPSYAGICFSVPLQISVRASTVQALVFKTSPAQSEVEIAGLPFSV